MFEMVLYLMPSQGLSVSGLNLTNNRVKTSGLNRYFRETSAWTINEVEELCMHV